MLINIFGGPGSGKSTMATGLYSELKWFFENNPNIQPEIVLEAAKYKGWVHDKNKSPDWGEIYQLQYEALERVRKADIIVTDWPPELAAFYSDDPVFSHDIMKTHDYDESIDFFIERTGPYKDKGRFPPFTEEDAKNADNQLICFLEKHGRDLIYIPKSKSGINFMLDTVISTMQKLGMK
jgi:hypothetical protein